MNFYIFKKIKNKNFINYFKHSVYIINKLKIKLFINVNILGLKGIFLNFQNFIIVF